MRLLPAAILLPVVLLLMGCSVEQRGASITRVYPQPDLNYDPESPQHTACLLAVSDEERYGTPTQLGSCVNVVFEQEVTGSLTRIGFSDFARREAVHVTWRNGVIEAVSRQPLGP